MSAISSGVRALICLAVFLSLLTAPAPADPTWEEVRAALGSHAEQCRKGIFEFNYVIGYAPELPEAVQWGRQQQYRIMEREAKDQGWTPEQVAIWKQGIEDRAKRSLEGYQETTAGRVIWDGQNSFLMTDCPTWLRPGETLGGTTRSLLWILGEEVWSGGQRYERGEPVPPLTMAGAIQGEKRDKKEWPFGRNPITAHRYEACACALTPVWTWLELVELERARCESLGNGLVRVHLKAKPPGANIKGVAWERLEADLAVAHGYAPQSVTYLAQSESVKDVWEPLSFRETGSGLNSVRSEN